MKYELIVVGGGFGGVGAAIAAARNGVKTLLIEKTNSLGGEAAKGLVMPFMSNRTKIGDNFKWLSGGIFSEMTDRLNEAGYGIGKTRYHDEYLKLLLNRLVLESGAELLFDTTVVSVEREGNTIKSVDVFGKGKTYKLEADYFIDASGDANLTAMAGFPFRLGRDEDNLCQPMTLCFRMTGVDKESFKEHRDEINPLYKKFKEEGKFKNPREDVLVFDTLIDNCLHFNTTRIVKLDPTNIFDVTKAEIEAREQMFEIFEFLKENFECFKNSEIISSAAEIGVRESRMIDGEYLLTGEEIKKCPGFEDSIAVGNYDIDIHNPTGSGTSHYYFPAGEYYEIPYRTLVPKNSENLLVAGRCISVDHEAQASVRIMPIVCCLGEAAGTAIAVAKSNGTDVKNVDIKKVQDILLKNGAILH